MRAYVLIGVLLISILIIGCAPAEKSGPLCKPPYYEYMIGKCCLDANNNSICDNDEVPKKIEIEEPQEEKEELLIINTLDDVQNKINEISSKYYQFQLGQQDEDHNTLFNYSELKDYKFYISDPREDYVIIKIENPKYYLNSFEDLNFIKELLINKSLEESMELVYEWIEIGHEGFEREKNPRDYEIISDIFVEEKPFVNKKALKIDFMKRIFMKNTLEKYYLQTRMLIPCSKDLILMQRLYSQTSGEFFLGADKDKHIPYIQKGTEDIFKGNLQLIETFINFCSKGFEDGFYSTSISSSHKEYVLKTEDYKYNISLIIKKGIPEDVESFYLKTVEDKKNAIFFRFDNFGIKISELKPIFFVKVTFNGEEKEFKREFEDIGPNLFYENYIEISQDAKDITVKAGLYTSWAKDEAYAEKTVHFE